MFRRETRSAPLSCKTIRVSKSSKATNQSRVQEFDKETESMYNDLLKQQAEELEAFNSEWVLRHQSELEAAADMLRVRNLEAREELDFLKLRLEHDQEVSKRKLLRRQSHEQEEFYKQRRAEKKVLIEEEDTSIRAPNFSNNYMRRNSKPSSRLSTSRNIPKFTESTHSLPIATRAPTKSISESYFFSRPKRSPFEQNGVSKGLFKSKKPITIQQEVDLLDPESLQKFLDNNDHKIDRYKAEKKFIKHFEDEDNEMADGSLAADLIFIGDTDSVPTSSVVTPRIIRRKVIDTPKKDKSKILLTEISLSPGNPVD